MFGDFLITVLVYHSVISAVFLVAAGEVRLWSWWLLLAGPLVFWYGTVAMYLRLPRHERHLEVVSGSKGRVRGWMRCLRAYCAR